MKDRKKWSRGVKIALVVAALLVAIPTVFAFRLFVYPAVEESWMSEKFDSRRWKEEKGSVHWPTRLRMIDDLLGKHLLEGKKKEDIVALLGPSDKTPYFQEYDMVYWLGPERGLIRIDSEWLVLKLQGDFTCVTAKITRD